MDGLRIDPLRLRSLREEAELTQAEVAEQLRCHVRHYRKFESVARDDTARALPYPTAPAEPSAVKAHTIRRVLSERLGRDIAFTDIGTSVPPRRQARAGMTYEQAVDILGPKLVAEIRARLGPPKPLGADLIAKLVPILARPGAPTALQHPDQRGVA